MEILKVVATIVQLNLHTTLFGQIKSAMLFASENVMLSKCCDETRKGSTSNKRLLVLRYYAFSHTFIAVQWDVFIYQVCRQRHLHLH